MTDPPGESDKSAAIWDEYKYRHDLCWRLLFHLTAVAVTLSIVPYAAPDKTIQKLGAWLLMVPSLACFMTLLGLLWMQLELRHFAAVDTEYIEYRTKRSGQGQWNEYGSFPFVINSYLLGLLLLSVLNLFVVVDVWLPAQVPAIVCTLSMIHARVLTGFSWGIGLAVMVRGAVRILSDRVRTKAMPRRTIGLFTLALTIWAGLTVFLRLRAGHFNAPIAGSLPWDWFVATSVYALIGAGILIVLELALVDPPEKRLPAH